MTKMKVLALLAVMMMVMMMPAVASAQQVRPHVFAGTVTVNGLVAPAGTVVYAVIDGVEQGAASVSAGGRYVLKVKASSGGGTSIIFMVDNLTAAETASWIGGEVVTLDLTANAGGGGGGGPSDPGGTGPQGPAGSAGERGPVGPAGPAGPAGTEAGPAGSAGSAGSAGPAGPAGAAGAAGAAGGSGLAIVALILAIIAILGVAGVYFVSRRTA